MRVVVALALLAACRPPAEVVPGCGNGVLEPGEDCDDGDANGAAPDGCRASCVAPACGDGVVDRDEGCDDGGLRGGDGCGPDCQPEAGATEVEPNDDPSQAGLLPPDSDVHGSAEPGDVDCFAVEADEGGWLAADVHLGDACPAPARLTLFDPSGALVASSGAGGDGRCAPLDPLLQPGARFLAAGTYALCVQGFLGGDLPAYTLRLSVGDDSCALALPVLPVEDLDRDGVADRCDADEDGDGVDDVDDNCPRTPNGPATAPPTLGETGFFRAWLTVGTFTGTESTQACRPSDDDLLGGEADIAPALGDLAGARSWRLFLSDSDAVNFRSGYGGPTPRELFAVTWVRADVPSTATLALGPDDGARAWWNGDEVLDISPCQGVSVDAYTADVAVLAGWNRLVVKVRDQGGGWGLFARLKDGDDPRTDLEISPTGAPWRPDQADRDGDGVGDVCDPEP